MRKILSAKDRRGFTLIEIIMAVGVLSIIAVPIAGVVIESVMATNHIKEIIVAKNLAQSEMAKVAGIKYADLGLGTSTQNVSGYPYTITRIVTDGTHASGSTGLKKIMVRVTPAGSQQVLTELATYKANPVRTAAFFDDFNGPTLDSKWQKDFYPDPFDDFSDYPYTPGYAFNAGMLRVTDVCMSIWRDVPKVSNFEFILKFKNFADDFENMTDKHLRIILSWENTDEFVFQINKTCSYPPSVLGDKNTRKTWAKTEYFDSANPSQWSLDSLTDLSGLGLEGVNNSEIRIEKIDGLYSAYIGDTLIETYVDSTPMTKGRLTLLMTFSSCWIRSDSRIFPANGSRVDIDSIEIKELCS